jgi:hypothetical protein
MSMIIDGTNGLTFNNATTQASAGTVLQVINTNLKGGVGSTITTPTASGLTATITPKFTTSKILVCFQVNGNQKNAGATDGGVRIWLYKNGSNLFASTAIDYTGYTNSSTVNDVGGVSMEIFDSPATTSATTYAVFFGSSSAGITASINAGNDYSTMTLMEIAG